MVRGVVASGRKGRMSVICSSRFRISLTAVQLVPGFFSLLNETATTEIYTAMNTTGVPASRVAA